MKNFIVAASMLIVGLVSASAQAATATTTFPVNINLTAACKVTTAPGAVTFNYTSMQATSATATGTTVGVTCTNTLPYSVSLATAPGNGYAVTDAVTNLAYTLTLNGTAADLAGQTGSGVEQVVTIGGTMAANQSGTCNTSAAACTNAGSANLTQTLTITY